RRRSAPARSARSCWRGCRCGCPTGAPGTGLRGSSAWTVRAGSCAVCSPARRWSTGSTVRTWRRSSGTWWWCAAGRHARRGTCCPCTCPGSGSSRPIPVVRAWSCLGAVPGSPRPDDHPPGAARAARLPHRGGGGYRAGGGPQAGRPAGSGVRVTDPGAAVRGAPVGDLPARWVGTGADRRALRRYRQRGPGLVGPTGDRRDQAGTAADGHRDVVPARSRTSTSGALQPGLPSAGEHPGGLVTGEDNQAGPPAHPVGQAARAADQAEEPVGRTTEPTEPDADPGPETAQAGTGGRGLRQLDSENFDALASVGGVRGMVEAVLPGVVFVVLCVITRELMPPLIASVAVAVLAALARLIGRTPVTQAVSGLLGVAIGAV